MKRKITMIAAIAALCILTACGQTQNTEISTQINDGTTETELTLTEDISSGQTPTDEMTSAEVFAGEITTQELTDAAAHEPARREGWKLSGVPAFTEGTLDTQLYVAGRGLTTSSKQVYQQNLSKVTAEQFAGYAQELELCGFVKEYENAIDGNNYLSYVKDGVRVYAYFMKNLKSVTVIKENLVTSFDDFCYKTDENEAKKAVLYAYGINGTGQLLLWHMSDGSWIINDGATDNIDAEKLFSFMCQKSGIDPKGSEKLKVALWYITHMHGDHTMGVVSMLKKYHSRIEIERMMWNVPEQSVISASSAKTAQAAIDSLINSYYKNVKFLRPHTGMEIQIGDVLFRVLVTQEDNTSKFYTKEYSDYNSTSTVCMTEFAGIRMFLPGDMKNGTLDNFVCVAYKIQTYTSPIIQVAHHGYNSMKAWYNLTLPKTSYAIFENTKSEGLKQGSGQDVYDAIGGDNCFFTDKTWTVRSVDGQIVIEAEK